MAKPQTDGDPRPMIRFRVDVKDQTRIKMIAAKAGVTIQELMTEALNDWLSKQNHRKLTELK